MILASTIIILVTILTVLQFFTEKQFVKSSAIVLGVTVVILGILDVNNKQNEYIETICTLSRIGTIIDWENSPFQIHLVNDFSKVDSNNAQVVLKIFSLNKTTLPPTSNLSFEKITAELEDDSGPGYLHLPEDVSRKLFHVYAEADGTIPYKNEIENHVDHINFSIKNIVKDHFRGTNINMSPDHLPNSKSPYLSLSDFNNTIVIARIVANAEGGTFLGWLNATLKTNIGPMPLYFKVKQISDEKLNTDSLRYVGIYIPENYFTVL